MTCHPLRFSARTLRACAFGALLLAGQLLTGSAALAKAQPPELAAAQFYRWFLHSLALRQDPLHQSPVQMSMYVSTTLMRELTRRMARTGVRADYFIQAQEFMDDWTTDIKAARPVIQGRLASVVVVLGATDETRRRLALTLMRDGGDWKICMVRLV